MIEKEDWIDNPHLVNSFLVVSFADLKKYIYQYRFHQLVIDNSSFSVSVTKSNLLHKVFKKEKEKLEDIKNAFLDNIKEENKESKHNNPFVVYSQDLKQVVTLRELIASPNSHILMFIDPSPKQPSKIVKNMLYAISTKLEKTESIKLISLRDKISKLGGDFEFKLS